jgi:nitrite reductase/ring-hydroxylating ferredoxin subunit
MHARIDVDGAGMTWHAVGKVDDLREGEVVPLSIGTENVALYRIEGRFYATSNICTHAMALMSDGYVDGDCIECPIHQALFHIPTGEVRSEPATEPLRAYPVKIENDQVLVELAD